MFGIHLLLYDYNFVLDPPTQKPLPLSTKQLPIAPTETPSQSLRATTIVPSKQSKKNQRVQLEQPSHQTSSSGYRSLTSHIHEARLPKYPVESAVGRPQGALALNAATLGVALLASRLNRTLDVFAFMSFSMT